MRAEPVHVQRCGDFVTYWWTEPPAEWCWFVVLEDEWSEDFRVRHIRAWRVATERNAS